MNQQYLKNVTSLAYDPELCRGCEKCVAVCPHGVFAMSGNKAMIVGRDRCMECGACVKNCPFGALAVDAGVGCAAAIIKGWLTGTEPSCC